MITIKNGPSFTMSWAPAPHRLLPQTPTLGYRKSLGQNWFVESPSLALTVDLITAASSVFFAWGLQNVRELLPDGSRGKVVGNKWSTFWWVVAGITFVKALHDGSRLGK
jgi:hypothetical protein